jgi:SET domain-containing protein
MNDDPDPLLEVRTSGIHGDGAFARRSLHPGQRVGVYRGRRYAEHEHGARDWDHALTYVFALSDGSVIDGSEGGNATRHINHSCAPNCIAYEVDGEDGEAQIVIEARRRIAAGEELFIDYALDVGANDPRDYRCRCGQPGCRGTMASARGERRRPPRRRA